MNEKQRLVTAIYWREGSRVPPEAGGDLISATPSEIILRESQFDDLVERLRAKYSDMASFSEDTLLRRVNPKYLYLVEGGNVVFRELQNSEYVGLLNEDQEGLEEMAEELQIPIAKGKRYEPPLVLMNK